MTLMIDPQDTFANTTLVGSADAQLVAIGAFMFVACCVIALQSVGVLLYHWVQGRVVVGWSLSRRQWMFVHMIAFTTVFALLL